MPSKLRLAVRAIIVRDNRLLLVNAYKPGTGPELWCAPGGGVEPHASLPDNLVREVYEETGLTIAPGPLVLVNEFHDPDLGFHQVDLFFRAQITAGQLSDNWRDTENIVEHRKFFSQSELAALQLKPSSLPAVAFDDGAAALYDPLEMLVR